MGTATAVLTGLNVYPLKSGGGTPLRTTEMLPHGLPHDREFMLITPEGVYITQREQPRMALLRPSFDGEVLTVDVADPAMAMSPLEHEPVDDGPVREVMVEGTWCRGVDQGDEAADWFSALLDMDCRMVRFTGRREAANGATITFVDTYPLLVLSSESLDDLNERLAGTGGPPLPMNRFRPSLVIEGLGPYGEDGARLLRVGDTVIEMVQPCPRCKITTTCQDTGARGKEPLRTLATYRRDADGGVVFGQNAVPRTTGRLAVGDPVEIIEPA
jgi:uncharacterized protein YcbX